MTLFSAPNYCGEFDNAGGVLIVGKNLMCSMSILKVSFPLNFPHSVGLPVTGALQNANNWLTCSRC